MLLRTLRALLARLSKRERKLVPFISPLQLQRCRDFSMASWYAIALSFFLSLLYSGGCLMVLRTVCLFICSFSLCCLASWFQVFCCMLYLLHWEHTAHARIHLCRYTQHIEQKKRRKKKTPGNGIKSKNCSNKPHRGIC